jgi:4-amino-4-deoxy-L-arabinose transferase-like glycosyltransferase
MGAARCLDRDERHGPPRRPLATGSRRPRVWGGMNMTTSTRAAIPSLQTVKIVLFLLVWASCAWFGSWEMNTNNAVRVYAAISLVEDGDATIDEFDSATIDKSRVGDHLYLDKAPGMSLMALPAVAALHLLSPQRSKTLTKTFFDPDFSSFIRARTRLAVATGPAILTALATVLLFDLALTITGSVSGALAAALGYALATPAWGWSTTLLGHAPVAALYVIALWAGERATQDSQTRRWAALLVGISLGFAVVIEYQAVLAGVAIALWVVWRTWRRVDRTRLLALAAAGGALGLMPLAGYNLIAYGSVLRLGYQGVVSFPGFDHGIFGIGLPDLKVLWNIVSSRQRGLLFYAPILVFGVGGLFLMCRDRATRDIGIVATAVVAITLFLHASYFYWEGGNSTGPRLSIPMVGVLALGIAPAWVWLGRSGRFLFAIMLCMSIAINACIAATEIYAVPTVAFPLRDAVLGPFLSGNLRTLASEYLGWPPGASFILWESFALPLLCWLAHRATIFSSDRRG